MSSGKIHLVEVIPLAKGAYKEHLSYFSTEKVRPGQIVRAPLKGRETPALVLTSRDARSEKTALKSSDFSLRKIPKKNILDAEIPPSFLEAAKNIALYSANPLSLVLSLLIPRFILDEPEFLKSVKDSASHPDSNVVPKEPSVIQMEREERYGHYRSIIRQCFARAKSALFVVPTIEEAGWAYEELSKGIEEYAFLFSSNLGKKDRRKVWLKARDMEHPVLMVTTPSGLMFNRADLDTIILERENSLAYKTFTRPFINFKKFVEYLARYTKRDLVMGDSVLSVETLWKEREDVYGELSPLKSRLDAAETLLVDMKERATENGFEIFSRELKDLISEAEESRKGIFLFGVRKGLAPNTVCHDCGDLLLCANCKSTMVLHEEGGQSVYVCHHCGMRKKSITLCDNCGSWNLVPLGIGTDLIAKTARKLFPKSKVSILDKDHVKSAGEAKKTVKGFENNGGILVGTELSFFYLKEAQYVGLVSADSLFSLPHFRAEERIFYTISRLRELSKKRTIIQSRRADRDILAWAASGNIVDFYKKEIAEREALFYPPFSIFIKVSGVRILEVRERFAKWQPDYVRDALIMRLPIRSWPDRELYRELSLLTPDFLIKVEPESLL